MLPKKYKEETKGQKAFYSVLIVILYLIIAAAVGLAIYFLIKDFVDKPINYVGGAVVITLIILALGESSFFQKK